MKNNQRNRNQRNHQEPHCDERIPAPEAAKRIALVGADISISEETTVTIPRSEYDDLMYSAALLDILHRLYKTVGKYTMGDLLANIFSGDEAEKEDVHE